MLRLKIILYFIYFCIKLWVKPWRFFQLNAKYFNDEKGIFSKYEIEQLIADKWRLKSCLINNNTDIIETLKWFKFPVFFKPEWSQNSHWVKLFHCTKDLKEYIFKLKSFSSNYIIQEASKYKREYELCYSIDPKNQKDILLHSIVESKNPYKKKNYVNGIHTNTFYREVLWKINDGSKEKIKKYISEIWDFKLARIWFKTDSLESFIKWNFQIFEINIFLPMPLLLLAENINKNDKEIFLKKWSKNLVELSKNIPEKYNKPIFFRKMLIHYKIKINNNNYMKAFKRFIYKFVEDKFLQGCSDYNSLEVRKSCRSKEQARNMFKKHNVPHAKGTIFFNPYKAYKFVKKHWFPVCIKPNVWWYSRWSYFPINTWKDFWFACFLVKIWWPTSVIEKYLLWKNYRVVVTKTWWVEIVMQRYPSFVVWDGIKTISDLIDIENKIRSDMKLSPVIHLIEKNKRTKDFLKKQWLTLNSVLEKERKTFLFHRVSLAPWGILETINISKITKKNKEIFLKILDSFDSNIFWIDVIMEKGISIDYDKQKCIFLEVNSRPYLKMHEFPRYWKVPNMNKIYANLERLEIKDRWIF